MQIHRHHMIDPRPAPARNAWSAEQRSARLADIRAWLIEAGWCVLYGTAGALVTLAVLAIGGN